MKTGTIRSVKIAGIVLVLGLIQGCSSHPPVSDAYGNFETTDRLISAEAAGQLLWFTPEEGDILDKNDTLGMIDTTALYLNKATLMASLRTVEAKTAGLTARKKVLSQQLTNLKVEQQRVASLFNAKAATQRQLDDINGKVKVMQLQIREIEVQQQSVGKEMDVIHARIAGVNEQIDQCFVVNPVRGTLLEKYAEAGEQVAPGKVLYRLADLTTMLLKVYVDETYLSKISVGDKATILIDNAEGGMDTLSGTIAWISGEAEFTPKIIQTRKERVNLVYAVKIRVKNDGRLKIGMPAEANF